MPLNWTVWWRPVRWPWTWTSANCKFTRTLKVEWPLLRRTYRSSSEPLSLRNSWVSNIEISPCFQKRWLLLSLPPLIGIAGGLTALSKMPACNVQLLGNQKRVLSGFSQTSTQPHTGFVFHCPIVENTPPDLRRKAARLVSAKCALAARVDACHASSDGSTGRSLREDIERKMDRLQEPPPVKAVKPLAPPVEPLRKKRGGKRVRRQKERYAQTELRKQQNRMTFGEVRTLSFQSSSPGLAKLFSPRANFGYWDKRPSHHFLEKIRWPARTGHIHLQL